MDIGARKREEERRRNFEAKSGKMERDGGRETKREIGKYETQERAEGGTSVRKRKYRHVEGSERDTSFFSDERRKRGGGGEGERDTQGMESRKANLTFISGILGFAL